LRIGFGLDALDALDAHCLPLPASSDVSFDVSFDVSLALLAAFGIACLVGLFNRYNPTRFFAVHSFLFSC